MKTLVECKWESERQPEEGDTVYEKGQYQLLHWGTSYKIIELGDGRIAVANFSVGICQNCKTGDVELFLPDQIKILGITNTY